MSSTSEQKISFLFDVFTFPKDLLPKKQLITLLSGSIKADDLKSIKSDQLNVNQFIELNNQTLIMHEMVNYLDRVAYIPYLFFKMKPEEKSTEKKAIEIVMKGEKNLSKFIEASMEKVTDYYIVDFSFWETWCKQVDWVEISLSEKSEERSNILLQKNEQNLRRLCINTLKISEDKTGRLKQGLIYQKDYVVFTKSMYELLSRWYPVSGGDLKVKKIAYDYSYEVEESLKDLSALYQISSDMKLIYEIELFPICIVLYSFDEIIDKITDFNPDNVKKVLSELIEKRIDMSRIYLFSRKTQLKDVKTTIEKSSKYGKSKSIIWAYNKINLFKVDELMTLEDSMITDFNLIILEVMSNNIWVSDTIFQTQSEEVKDSTTTSLNQNRNDKKPVSIRSSIGIANIGNTCYMNTVLQILFNLTEIKEFFLNSQFKYFVNYKNKFGFKGIVMRQFVELIKEKWSVSPKCLVPTRFKEVIGDLNNQFKGSDQQDAQEFFNYLLDVLHEEINLKDEKEYIMNPDKYDGTDEELANEYWANNLRRNISFIHSLFLGQLRSNLSCMVCESNKTSYETFTSLILPIPQKKMIVLEVILHRIPFIFKTYYNLDTDKTEVEDSNLKNMDIRQSLMKLRRASFDEYSDTDQTDVSNKDTGTGIYTSRLSTSLPIRIILEIDRKSKVDKIIEELKNINELELEGSQKDGENVPMTSFVVMTSKEGSFIDQDLKIDECFQNNQLIFVYELLNTNGIQNYLHNKTDINMVVKVDKFSFDNTVFNQDNKDIIHDKVIALNSETLKNYNNPFLLEQLLSSNN